MLKSDTLDERQKAMLVWLGAHNIRVEALSTVGSDASTRRYFRVQTPAGSRVVMDAPNQSADCERFVSVQRLMAHAGVHVPRIECVDTQAGWMLLEDLGSCDYLQALATQSPDALISDALVTLVRWQAATQANVLPAYDATRLGAELDLFETWYVRRHLGVTPDAHWLADWHAARAYLIEAALAQPQVWVHRDFMVRNLVCVQPNPGVIDFQDALMGPVTYDLVSLLRDAFISFTAADQARWIAEYAALARSAGIALPDNLTQAMRYMGAQRHLKVLGIFARLRYRDNKPAYLRDAPRFLHYLGDELVDAPALQALAMRLEALPPGDEG